MNIHVPSMHIQAVYIYYIYTAEHDIHCRDMNIYDACIMHRIVTYP